MSNPRYNPDKLSINNISEMMDELRNALEKLQTTFAGTIMMGSIRDALTRLEDYRDGYTKWSKEYSQLSDSNKQNGLEYWSLILNNMHNTVGKYQDQIESYQAAKKISERSLDLGTYFNTNSDMAREKLENAAPGAFVLFNGSEEMNLVGLAYVELEQGNPVVKFNYYERNVNGSYVLADTKSHNENEWRPPLGDKIDDLQQKDVNSVERILRRLPNHSDADHFSGTSIREELLTRPKVQPGAYYVCAPEGNTENLLVKVKISNQEPPMAFQVKIIAVPNQELQYQLNDGRKFSSIAQIAVEKTMEFSLKEKVAGSYSINHLSDNEILFSVKNQGEITHLLFKKNADGEFKKGNSSLDDYKAMYDQIILGNLKDTSAVKDNKVNLQAEQPKINMDILKEESLGTNAERTKNAETFARSLKAFVDSNPDNTKVAQKLFLKLPREDRKLISEKIKSLDGGNQFYKSLSSPSVLTRLDAKVSSRKQIVKELDAELERPRRP